MSQNNINPNCPCNSNCERHGKCVECIDHHRKEGNPVACMRELLKNHNK